MRNYGERVREGSVAWSRHQDKESDQKYTGNGNHYGASGRSSASFKGIARSLSWILMSTLLIACGGGSGGSPVGTDVTPGECSGDCADTSTFLTVEDVRTVIAQATAEANAQGVSATIAVVDRVGNVLGVHRMAPQTVLIASELDADGAVVIEGGLEGAGPTLDGLDGLAAISKAVTGAYLSSEGNAFTSRTASQIVQENFNPGEQNQPAGPLFGVQFSQFSCSDFTQSQGLVGPQRSPLGLSADPGGLPLYKGGTAVGGIGVIADGLYSLDKIISDFDQNIDELVATAGSFGFSAPLDRRADAITIDGKNFRFSDVDFSDLISALPASIAPPGVFIAVNGYTDGTLVQGTAFGQPESGIRSDAGVNFPGRDAFVFVDNANALRFPPRAGTDGATLGGNELSESEVRTLIDEALAVANRARAQIRRPLGTTARVTISVVDTDGEILGMARTRDAPVFGADVSLQKARTATFFSNIDAAAFLQTLPDAVYVGAGRTSILGNYVTAVQSFLDDSNALVTGDVAFSDRAGGNLSRPFFPDGISSAQNGPLSKPQGEWSVFSTGLQLDLSLNAVLQHILFALGLPFPDVSENCAGVFLAPDLSAVAPSVTTLKLANGLQIFPGSVPVYRGGTLIGGIGVSGDGVDQDDMIAFLGLHNAGLSLGGAINNAPPDIRADQLTPQNVRLRYIQCPQAPFVDSDETNVCEGI
ncbi:MAG: heme-binding protein [Pseudomonadales bacterium]|nr:heme-binding protein [Pseudomonadales bacterium]